MMNKNFLKQTLLFAFLLIFFISCKKDNEPDTCLSYTTAPVINVTGANTALVNQEIDIAVEFGIFNGCGEFINIDEIITGNTSIINVNVKYEGCVCTQVVFTPTKIYKFKKLIAGTYELKFKQADNTYLTHSIVVE